MLDLDADGGSLKDDKMDGLLSTMGDNGFWWCYDKATEAQAFDPLWAYMNRTSGRGPESKLWMTQAHWQSSASSVVAGTLHGSSVLLDVQRSQVNQRTAEKLLKSSDFCPSINLLEVDDICNGGSALRAALKNREDALRRN